MIARAAGGLALGAVLLVACARAGEHADTATNGAPVRDSVAARAGAVATSPPPNVTRVPSRLRRCASPRPDSVTVAGTDSLSAFFLLLAGSAPSSEDSMSTAHLPVDRVMAVIGDSGLVYVDSSGAAPPVESKAVRRYTRAAVAEQLASKRGAVWEALATAALGLARPETEAPPPFMCGMQDAVTLFVGDGSYRLVFTTEHGVLRLTRIAYEPAEGN